MTSQQYNDSAPQVIPVPESYVDDGDQEPGLVDAIRFLYRHRIKLTFHFFTILSFGVLAFLYWRFTSPKSVEGIVGLNFPEIKTGTYPSGRTFSLEDFRSPVVLTEALADAAVSAKRIAVRDLAAHVDVTPLIPGEIENRWKKQEQAGAKKEPYTPSDFTISIDVGGLTDQERLRLFDSLVRRYQETAKYDQKATMLFMPSSDLSYDKLSSDYDPWDLPEFFGRTYQTLKAHLQSLVAESSQYQDAGYQLSFLEIVRDVDTWVRTRLQPLEALTYQGRLVKNRDLIALRIQYRLQELDIADRQKSQEATEAGRLLEIISRSKTLVAGQINSRESLPVIDTTALARLIKSDYVGPVVQRISRLQGEVQAIRAEKAQLEQQFSFLPKSSEALQGPLPPEYQGLIAGLSADLSAIIQRYDHLLEDYLTATITSLVVVKQAPVLSRSGYSTTLVLPGIALLSAFLAILLLGIERLFERARGEESPNTHSQVR